MISIAILSRNCHPFIIPMDLRISEHDLMSLVFDVTPQQVIHIGQLYFEKWGHYTVLVSRYNNKKNSGSNLVIEQVQVFSRDSHQHSCFV